MLLSNLSKVIRVNKTYNFNKNKYFSAITSNSKFTNNKTLFVYDKNTKVKTCWAPCFGGCSIGGGGELSIS